MRRRDGGRQLRAAMADTGLSLRGLSVVTSRVDPDDRGVSAATLGNLSGSGASARDFCSDRVADLIARALRVPVGSLFESEADFVRTRPSRNREIGSAVAAGGMVTAKELASLLVKHVSWVYDLAYTYPASHPTPFPVRYVGKSPRYFPSEVYAWLAVAFPGPSAG